LKHWLKTLVLVLGILLVLGSFAAYGWRVSQTIIPAGSTPEQIDQLEQQYGLVGPLALQYPLFTYLFLPGMTILALYGMLAVRRQESVHSIYTKIFLVLLLISSLITAFNYLLQAPPIELDYPLDFWLNIVLIGLVLASFVFTLAIWNEYKWGVWAYGVVTCMIFILSFIGGIPISVVCLGPLGLIVLYVLVKPAWIYMR
jgi:hypothetical protein